MGKNNRDKVITTEGVIWRNVRDEHKPPIYVPKRSNVPIATSKFTFPYAEFVAQEPLRKCPKAETNNEKCYFRGDKVCIVGPTDKKEVLIFARGNHYKKSSSDLPITSAVLKHVELEIKAVGFYKKDNSERVKCYKVVFKDYNIWLEEEYMDSCTPPMIIPPPTPLRNETPSPPRRHLQRENPNQPIAAGNDREFYNEIARPPPPMSTATPQGNQIDALRRDGAEEARGPKPLNVQQFQPPQQFPVLLQSGMRASGDRTPSPLLSVSGNDRREYDPQVYPANQAYPGNAPPSPFEQFVYHSQRQMSYLFQGGANQLYCYYLPDDWENYAYPSPVSFF